MTRVLAVLDSATQFIELERTLAGFGYDVEAVPDASAARAALALRRPDVIVADIVMPGISGFDLCRALKADPATREIPVLLLTSLAEPLDSVHGQECGADHYVTKPYPPALLAERIVRVLESRRDRASRETLAKQRALESATHELEAFTYSVSHDLRAPLRAIEGFSQVLQEVSAGQLDATGQMYLDRIRAAAQRMSRLIDGMLHLSRITRAPLHHATVDLSATAHSVLEALQSAEPPRVVEIVVQDDVTVRGDPALLRAVLENLLGNAWKFTSRRVDARIELTASSVADETVIRIRDNGAGFDMAYANRLFAPFARLHSATEFPGTGVGLATVQRIVLRHGGRVWAEGDVDKGASFYVALPATGPQAE